MNRFVVWEKNVCPSSSLPSERLSGTEAVGDRLKEGVSINQSLACLGNCIHSLAEQSSGKNVRGESWGRGTSLGRMAAALL